MKKLHLGCGRNIKPGFVNLDIAALDGVDVVADLNRCKEVPLPFEDNEIQEFFAGHLIEHIYEPLSMMEELYRIAAPGALAVFCCPYGSSDDAWEDPTHIRPYFLNSFRFFSQPCYWRADYNYKGDWETEEIVLLMPASRFSKRTVEELFEIINTQRNCVYEMRVSLRAIKPAREPKRELIKQPSIRFKFA